MLLWRGIQSRSLLSTVQILNHLGLHLTSLLAYQNVLGSYPIRSLDIVCTIVHV